MEGFLVLIVQADFPRALLDEISKSVDVDQMELFAFMIMGNHYHLALRTGEIPLSKMMQRINSNFGRYYNRRKLGVWHLRLC